MKVKEDFGSILILVAYGMLVGVAISFCISVFEAPSEEQVSIQEEEMEIIHTQEISLWCEMVVVHDNQRNVTCWCYQGGLVCIPDHMLTP